MDRLIGKNIEELKTLVTDLGLPSFCGKQISDWLYKKRVRTIDEMTNISKRNRETLSQHYCVGIEAPQKDVKSKDGTIKYLFETVNGPIETVYIPENDRATLCVSSQVGCKMGCSFCMTGKMGFLGQLTTADIINQILAIPESETLTNVVYMGMGEPMDNIDNVLASLKILTSDYGLGWSPKRITVSTVGLLPGLRRFLKESDCHLAVSLHNPISSERSAIMPVEKAYPIKDVINELKGYDFTHQRRVSFEYTLIKGINDGIREAAQLVRILKGIECRVNLIKLHNGADENLRRTSEETAIRFRDYLNENGITSTIRKSRGEDIEAACGLLSTKEQQESSNDKEE